MMIKLLVPDMPNSDEILPYLRQIDANRQYSNFGPLNQKLEQRLESYLLSKLPTVSLMDKVYITTVANATLGLEIIFSVLDIPKKSHVLVPALTFPATATAVLRQGFVPVFSDIHPSSWLMTPQIARAAIEKNRQINLIVPVSAFGVPQNVTEWDLFTAETGIPVVIDAAGAFGNQLIGDKTHTVFSLHATKSLGGGEGGFIVTTNQTLALRIRTACNFGISTEHGKVLIPGTNAKLSEYHAAVALASLDRWDTRQQMRIQLLNYWLKQLYPLIEEGAIEVQEGMQAYSHSLLPLRFNTMDNIAELALRLEKKKIQTRRWYYPLLPYHPAFSSNQVINDLFFSKKLAEALLGMPFHLDLTTTEIDYMVDTLKEFCLIPQYS